MVQPSDVREAARYAIEILSRADRSREMGKTARINAKKNFCANAVIPFVIGRGIENNFLKL